jgi:CRP-like cAMP-binding protein
VTQDADVLVLSRQAFDGWLQEHGEASAVLLRTLSIRLRRTSESLSDRRTLDVSHRLAKHLLLLSREQAGPDAQRASAVSITQQDLAGMLGATREAVNKALRGLSEAGWIEVRRGSITVRDGGALERLM